MNREQKQRAVVVAALRELADLLESDESLPVPMHGGLQACVKIASAPNRRRAFQLLTVVKALCLMVNNSDRRTAGHNGHSRGNIESLRGDEQVIRTHVIPREQNGGAFIFS